MFGTVPGQRLDAVSRAMARARHAGASAALMDNAPFERLLREADVVVSLPWPPHGEPQTLVLAAMAAGKPVIVFESAASAEWPVLDPQTWQPRGLTKEAPIAVSIDPRDEEHSLVLAIRRLAAEPALRAKIGQAARDWWHTHATPALAANDWRRVLEEAALLPAPARPTDWPAHLSTETLRAN
jgi:glycosyltransferase involved in cell wall biosynthesis